MNERIWVQSKWRFEDLHGESVEFKLPVDGGEVQGTGQFVLARGENDLLSIDVRTVLRGDKPGEQGMFNFHLNQWATDRIERHAQPEKAGFRCWG